MWTEILQAFIIIFIAEMGDKTQILAMAFATKFPVKKVLLGVFIGSLLNHGIAVAFGTYISSRMPIGNIQIIAGVLFVLFALWTLKLEKYDDKTNCNYKFGAVITVATAFFIGELGDKTQLAAVTISATAQYPVLIVCGTVAGMVTASVIGIAIGKKLGDKIPEHIIKIFSAIIFFVVGTIKLFQNVPREFINVLTVSLYFVVFITTFIFIIRHQLNKFKRGHISDFSKKSKELYDYYHNINNALNDICLGKDICGECIGEKCIIGKMKALVQNEIKDDLSSKESEKETVSIIIKQYDREKVFKALECTTKYIEESGKDEDLEKVKQLKKNFEIILSQKKNQ